MSRRTEVSDGFSWVVPLSPAPDHACEGPELDLRGSASSVLESRCWVVASITGGSWWAASSEGVS